jgi:cell wall-associated NlpC family hydrolase
MSGTWVSKYLNIPFREGGRSPEGCDCWGIVALVLENEAGITLPSFSDISTRDGKSIYRKVQDEIVSGHWQLVEEPSEFDVCLMRGHYMEGLARIPAPTHVGIVSPYISILHIEEGSQAVCVNPTSVLIRNRIYGYYRFKR